ncbi:hypothetical protein QN277_011365 [Acacia crassicarpa]|uniref:Uncharacterized protein n=1 Tax=Acacia crassicarpa TaxID=499986 RepID=A0AAE1MYZ7_9FABA|nr:hypothetical protein QN277_011365 [Acacia crassicarpa]
MWESECRRCHQKQKKNKASQEPKPKATEDGKAADTANDDAKENTDPQQMTRLEEEQKWSFKGLMRLETTEKRCCFCAKPWRGVNRSGSSRRFW